MNHNTDACARGEAMGIREAAAMLGRSVKMTRVYIHREGLPCRRAKDGKTLLFDADEVREWSQRPEIRDMLQLGDLLMRRSRAAV